MRIEIVWPGARAGFDRLEHIMATVREEIAAIGAQLVKAKGEITGKIAELEAKIADGTVSVEDLAPLKAAAQGLDDVVEDAPAEPSPGEPEQPAEPE